MVGVRELRRTVGVLGQPPTTIIEQEDATISQPQKKEKEKKRKKKGLVSVYYIFS
jgi:hypothetical protein